ncbi:hypothetical protein DPQ33_12615 [Oceanidesulfovibrio indonesiensis]|uniref:Uncharacterized protein n=1 Tax=Oceanidesulfovibrio indonesiensis TaxID=54767 RepID=A0A7M3MD52_9BACT|nr:hypothetical protein [Oceanidesulfovibrio indonesiensis]TVM16448.1 hypothetical protein DPQ33_12615 [Oceanidesulfovibrio indonesiensis]
MHALEKREAEHALRAAGFSRSQAVIAVSVVNRVLKENSVPDRIFEAKVKPETIRKRIERSNGTNVPDTPTHENDTQKGGDNGDRPHEGVSRGEVAV